MSFLICGFLRFGRGGSWDFRQGVAFEVAQAGLAERLAVLSGLNVAAAPTAFEILNIPDGPLRDDELAFLITDSPADPTADGLICPIENSEDALRDNMRRLRRFFASLWR